MLEKVELSLWWGYLYRVRILARGTLTQTILVHRILTEGEVSDDREHRNHTFFP